MDQEANKRVAMPDLGFGKYIGCKLIKAKPMSKFEWLELNGTDTTNLDQPNLEGYLVIYPDGYQSWSPKEVFETAYRLVTDSEIDLIRS